ncbi:P-type conjugative transfer protein TrbL [Nitrosomonas supralitoralis]|uniref:P-type conjugative transfer protein TrbL n=2 Tax=Nitrosomonas supralitoralis TaxID=2116706 RepID=A0A2P7NSS0_9PROT|nr:P-type conjugative transfer protein TrbL [Nitrosomonas supralitoralis]
MLVSTAAFAELAYIDPATNQSVLEQVTQKFFNKAKNWKTALEAAATRLFWTLVLISMVWTFGMMILRKADLGDFFAEFTRFIIFTGFFFWLLTNAVSGHNIGGTIIESMQVLGNQASGMTGSGHGNVMDIGFQIFRLGYDNLNVLSPIDSLLAIILSLIILIILAVVAVNMLLLLISSWVLLYAGIFLLGFGGARWTTDFAINYFKTVLGIGIQLMVMTLIVGIGSDFLINYYGKMNQNIMNFEELGVMLIFVIAFYVLVSKLPPMIAGIITGSSINAGGVGNYSGGQVVGAAAATMAVASMGATYLAEGARQMAAAGTVAADAAKSIDTGGTPFATPNPDGSAQTVSHDPWEVPDDHLTRKPK